MELKHAPRVVMCDYFAQQSPYGIDRIKGRTDWLLFFTIGGSGRIHHGKEIFTTEKHQLLLYEPHARQNYWALDRGWNFYWVHFYPKASWIPWLNWSSTLVPGLKRLDVPGKIMISRIESAFRRMLEADRGISPYKDLLLLNCLEEILLNCAELIPEAGKKVLDSRIRHALTLLSRDLAAPHTVDSLGQAIGLSGSRLAHLFKEETGLSVIETLLDFRLRQACRLLEHTSLPVKTVAADTGFNSPYYFTRLFTSRLKMSPKAYRRKFGS